MKTSLSPIRVFSASVAFCALLAVSPAAASDSTPSVAVGAKILRSELPDVSLDKAECEPLAHAVHRAVLKDHNDAASILLAALTGGEVPGSSRVPKRACKCVTRIFHAAYTAAPRQAASLLEQVVVLYPDCADDLQKMIESANDKNVVDGKDSVAGLNAPGTPGQRSNDGINGQPADGANAQNGDPNGGYSFGAGFGPGFPGSPGFVGSAPGGGIALPSPMATPVTSVTND